MLNSMVLESTCLITLRLCLFLACRKFLLRSLYSDLQALSSPQAAPFHSSGHAQTGSTSDADIELQSLPTPASASHAEKSKFRSGERLLSHSTMSRTVFSISFMESCMMFILLMLQGLDMFLPRTRLVHWRSSLALLMTTILVFVPLSMSLMLAMKSSPRTERGAATHRRLVVPRILFSLAVVCIYLYGFSHIPLPAALASSDTLTAMLSRLIVIGILVLGLLSGFGAVSNSWPYIPLLSRTKSVPTEQDIVTAENALHSVRTDLRFRTAEAERRARSSGEEQWLSRVVNNLRGGDDHYHEIRGLQALEYEMAHNFETLQQRFDAARQAKTLKGKIYIFAGRIFAVYCIIRILSSIINLLTPVKRSSSSQTYPDLIAGLLAYVLSLLSSAEIKVEDIAVFSRQLSLVLIGLLIITSIRLVLRSVTRALRITSRNMGASFMLLLLAQLMGIYLLSTVVQMRKSFPPPIVRPDQDAASSNLFSTVPDFEVFGSLFDWSFLLSVAVSMAIRWSAEKINGVGEV